MKDYSRDFSASIRVLKDDPPCGSDLYVALFQKIVWAAGTVEERACEKVRARLQRVSVFNDDRLDEALAI
jgi:hypothetical protein